MRHTPAAARPAAKRLSQLLLGASLLFGASMAWAADLFVVTAPNRFAEVSPGVYPLRVNADALANMSIGDSVRLNLPGLAEQAVVLDRLERASSGNVTWIGHVAGQGNESRVIITISVDGAVGQMLLADSFYRIEGNRVVQPALAGEKDLVPTYGDGRAVPPGARQPRPPESEVDNTFAANAPTRIDLMVLYTSGMVTTAAADGGIDAVIDNLIAIANQAYIDSGIAIQVHLVYKQRSDYLEDNDNGVALEDLSNASDIALVNVPALRKQYGADLVTIIRPLDGAVMTSCGVAWVGGSDWSSFDPSSGFSIVSYGKFTFQNGDRISCSKYTLVHELGHNMGAAHDRIQATKDNKGVALTPDHPLGAYSYSYGYGLSGQFGTIMSYVEPRIGLFSSPNLTYKGYPVGAPESQLTASADNARTLNNTRNYVAGYMPMTVDLPLTGIVLSLASVRVGTTVTIAPVPSAAALGTCSSDNSSIASVSGTTVSTLAAGTVNISCSGFSASLTVLPPLPVQAFGVAASQSAASNGNVKLQLTLSPDAADIGKTADLYLVAHALVGSVDYWFVQYANGSWAPLGSTLLPFATRTLVSSDSSIVALNGEFAAATLKSLALDFYLGYTLSGASLSTLKYQKAYSFR